MRTRSSTNPDGAHLGGSLSIKGLRPDALRLADTLAGVRELQVAVVKLGALRGIVEEAVGTAAPIVPNKVAWCWRHSVGAGLRARHQDPLLGDWLRTHHFAGAVALPKCCLLKRKQASFSMADLLYK